MKHQVLGSDGQSTRLRWVHGFSMLENALLALLTRYLELDKDERVILVSKVKGVKITAWPMTKVQVDGGLQS